MKRKIIKWIYIAGGAFVAAIGFNIFLEPNGIAPGGISGIAMIVNSVTGGFLPVGIITLLLNIPLVFAAYKKIGASFAFKSVIGTFLYSVMIDATGMLTPFIREILFTDSANDHMMIFALWGGIMMGMGLGMIFKGGATTGGTDIAARIFQQRMDWLTIGQLVLIFDAIFLVVVAVTYKSVIAAMYTGVAVFVSSKIIDIVEAGVNYAKEVYICTEAPISIASEIMVKLQRGITKIKAEGMYTGEIISILWCVVYNRQLHEVRRIVDKYDPDAFIIVKEVRETKGLHE